MITIDKNDWKPILYILIGFLFLNNLTNRKFVKKKPSNSFIENYLKYTKNKNKMYLNVQ